MLKTQTVLLYAVIVAIFFTSLFTIKAEAAAPGNNLSPGGKCEVTEGPNKGEKGTYGDDGWCEGDWGGTECGESKCKDVAKGSTLGGVGVFDGRNVQTTVTQQVYESKDKDLIHCTTTSLAGATSSVTAVCVPIKVVKLVNMRESKDKATRNIAEAIDNATNK